MRANRSRDTGPERALRRALAKLGLRGTPHARVLGTPDVAWVRARLAVFVDGDFWHGRAALPKTHRAFWRAKFRRNQARDRAVTRGLRRAGWSVLRLRDSTVAKDPDACAWRVARLLEARRAQ